MEANSRLSLRGLKSAALGTAIALALWELARREHRSEFSNSADGFSALSRFAIALGGFFGGILFSRSPNAREESKVRRYIRWVIIMLVVLSPSATVDLFRGAPLVTAGWTIVVSFGLALTAWFIQQRLLSFSGE